MPIMNGICYVWYFLPYRSVPCVGPKWTPAQIFSLVYREGNYRRLFFIGRCVRDVDEHFERPIRCEDNYR